MSCLIFSDIPSQFSPVIPNQPNNGNPRMPSPSSLPGQAGTPGSDLRTALTQPSKIRQEQQYRQFKVSSHSKYSYSCFISLY